MERNIKICNQFCLNRDKQVMLPEWVWVHPWYCPPPLKQKGESTNYMYVEAQYLHNYHFWSWLNVVNWLVKSSDFLSDDHDILHTRKSYLYLCPPSKKEGHIALHMSVGMSVGRSVCRSIGMSVALNLVQLITPERFAPEASNFVGSPWWVDDPYW